MSEPVGVYISVPFCKAKCTFCNFASDAFGAERMDRYVDRLCEEISASRSSATQMEASLPQSIDTIYFGGGTPSLLSADQFRKIFARLHDQFEIASNAEITLECAPGQLSRPTLDELLAQGLNRVSLGVQSFVDRESAAIGRLHTKAICEAEIARIRAAGISNINLDLIVGLPHQTEESWGASLRSVVESAVPHVSLYLLEVDEDSRLGREMLEQGSRYSANHVPSEDAAADWYQQGCEVLGAAGIAQYEISNFAQPEARSSHNIKYWRRDPYLGFGLDAHSMLRSSRGDLRFANTDDLDSYLNDGVSDFPQLSSAKKTPTVEVIRKDQALEESLFLGLRLNEGVDLSQLRYSFGEIAVEATMPSMLEMRDTGLLEFSADRIRLTARGRLVSNEVFSRLLIPVSA